MITPPDAPGASPSGRRQRLVDRRPHQAVRPRISIPNRSISSFYSDPPRGKALRPVGHYLPWSSPRAPLCVVDRVALVVGTSRGFSRDVAVQLAL
jgi:hypothetical protein